MSLRGGRWLSRASDFLARIETISPTKQSFRLSWRLLRRKEQERGSQ
jgi:hypothetical protein